jgi:hypothetical protein
VSLFENVPWKPIANGDDSNGRSCEPRSSGSLNIDPFITRNGPGRWTRLKSDTVRLGLSGSTSADT